MKEEAIKDHVKTDEFELEIFDFLITNKHSDFADQSKQNL